MLQTPFYTIRKKGIIQVKLNGKYQLKEGDQFFETVETLVGMINEKNAKHKFDKHMGICFFSSLQFVLSRRKMEEEQCSICLDEFVVQDIEREIHEEKDSDVYALPCSHIYHAACLIGLIGDRNWLKCPVCMTIYGRMSGDMPEGKMKVDFNKSVKCVGYQCGTIVIAYSFQGCERNGKKVPGTSRTGYLPDTEEGREVLDLLKQCFDRKLTFTVGRSVTTGLDNQIVWNGIHHKTGTSGGAANFGYPDPTYLKRVKQQLAAKGIKLQPKKVEPKKVEPKKDNSFIDNMLYKVQKTVFKQKKETVSDW